MANISEWNKCDGGKLITILDWIAMPFYIIFINKMRLINNKIL